MKSLNARLAGAVLLLIFVAAPLKANANLIVNGNFAAGNTGFTSGYTYVTPGSNALYPEGLYTIGSNPNAVHQFWVNEPSAPTMLLENGYAELNFANVPVWEEDGLNGVAGQTYSFDASIMDLCCNSTFTYPGANAPSEIEFQVSYDGGVTWTPILTDTTTPGFISPSGDDGVLESFSSSFTDAGGPFDIRAIDLVDAASGNDFGITDLSLTAIPEPMTLSLFGGGLVAAGVLRRRKKKKAV